MMTLDQFKKQYDEWYFVPWDIGLLAKKWDELTPAEREIAVPAALVYSGDIKF
jgi:hypothetical protein